MTNEDKEDMEVHRLVYALKGVCENRRSFVVISALSVMLQDVIDYASVSSKSLAGAYASVIIDNLQRYTQ